MISITQLSGGLSLCEGNGRVRPGQRARWMEIGRVQPSELPRNATMRDAVMSRAVNVTTGYAGCV